MIRNKKKSCLITGASGFVGSALMKSQFNQKYDFIPVYRQKFENNIVVENIDDDTDWSSVLENIDVVIHIAACVRSLSDLYHDQLIEFRKMNVDGTLNIAHQAAEAGVQRFIFISSVKVNGESTTGEKAFTEESAELPDSPYALSKYEAEVGLKKMAAETGMDVVVIRPPLIYGPKVKANFLALIKLADTAMPLPFRWVNNKRSMVYIENLVEFIAKCIDHSAAANQTFLISDGDDLSLKKLLEMLRIALGRPIRLLPFPSLLFRFMSNITGKAATMDRIIGDLQVDASKAQEILGWRPTYTLQQGMSTTVTAYLNDKVSDGEK